ncbi:unnamed protein product [Lepidochelys olivacea]
MGPCSGLCSEDQTMGLRCLSTALAPQMFSGVRDGNKPLPDRGRSPPRRKTGTEVVLRHQARWLLSPQTQASFVPHNAEALTLLPGGKVLGLGYPSWNLAAERARIPAQL